MIGAHDNSKSMIRHGGEGPVMTEAVTLNVLDGDEFRPFWISWEHGQVVVSVCLFFCLSVCLSELCQILQNQLGTRKGTSKYLSACWLSARDFCSAFHLYTQEAFED